MYLYFLCCLMNIHIFDYPDSGLSRLFNQVPPSPDNRGSTALNYQPLFKKGALASRAIWNVSIQAFVQKGHINYRFLVDFHFFAGLS